MSAHEHIQRHAGKVALQFSGGRDSLALLLALRHCWHLLTVYWCNTGDAYPETLALMAKVKALVPSFVEVRGRTPEVHARLGWPSDILQAGAAWPLAEQHYSKHVRLIDRHTCCFASLMEPLHMRMKADGMTLLLRGQRDCDDPKSHVKSGDVVDGMTILYPIATWTTEEVDRFIAREGWELPPFYAAGVTSMPDCMHCTAWLAHGATKYLAEHHKAEAAEVGKRLITIQLVVQPLMEALTTAQEDLDGLV